MIYVEGGTGDRQRTDVGSRPFPPWRKQHNVPVSWTPRAEILTVTAERAPAARRDARRLQRRQSDPRATERRPAARPQGSRPGGLGPQRAAPWICAVDEDRPRGNRRHGRGRRELRETRSRRRVERMGRSMRSHRQPADEDSGRRRQRAARAGRPRQPQSSRQHRMGLEEAQISPAPRSPRLWTRPSHASCSAAVAVDVRDSRRKREPTPASRCQPS